MIELRWLVRAGLNGQERVLQSRLKDRVISAGTDFNGQQYTACDWSEWVDVPTFVAEMAGDKPLLKLG